VVVLISDQLAKTYISMNIDACTTCNRVMLNFPTDYESSSKRCAPNNVPIVAMMPHNIASLPAACSGTSIFCESTVTFLQIFRKPNIDLELDCMLGKPMKRRFTVNFSCMSRIHFSLKSTIETNGPLGANNPRNCPFPLRHVDPIPYINAWAHSTSHAKQHLDPFMHFCTTTQQMPHCLQWDAPNLPPKLPHPSR